MAIDFLKGEMGGNRIVLLDGRQIPSDAALATALTVLDEAHLHGHQAGLLFPTSAPDRLRVRVVSISWRDFIPACGGLTQVLGKALVEGGLGERFGLQLTGAPLAVTLEFDAWPVELRLHLTGPKVDRTQADLTPFLAECRQRRIGPVDLDGIAAMQVGTFLVLDADAVREHYCDVSFDGPGSLDETAREVLWQLHRRFQERIALEAWDFALYDRRSQRGNVRVLFPHRLPMDHVEPSCGTGSVAVAVALQAAGVLPSTPRTGEQVVRLETGGAPTLGGPDLTTVTLGLVNGQPETVTFHHDRVTLTAAGTLYL